MRLSLCGQWSVVGVTCMTAKARSQVTVAPTLPSRIACPVEVSQIALRQQCGNACLGESEGFVKSQHKLASLPAM